MPFHHIKILKIIAASYLQIFHLLQLEIIILELMKEFFGLYAKNYKLKIGYPFSHSLLHKQTPIGLQGT